MVTKRILLSFLFMCFVLVGHGQFGGGAASTAQEIADLAMLVSIGVDVVDEALMADDKIKLVQREMNATQAMLDNPNFMKYSSSYARNKSLREVQNHAKTVQLYALTIKNLILMIESISSQAATVSKEKLQNQIEKIKAKAASAAGGTSIMGMQMSGSEDADVIAQLEDNKFTETSNSIQSTMLKILLEVDKFNNLIDLLYYESVKTRYKIESSFGIGVLTYHSQTNLNLYEYNAKHNAEMQAYASKNNKKAMEDLERTRREAYEAMKRLSKKLSEKYK